MNDYFWSVGPGNNSAAAWRIFLKENLLAVYDESEAGSITNRLFEDLLSIQSLDFIRDPSLKISESDILLLNKAFKRLLQSEPIQYVLGTTSFYNCDILCDPRALIPRPETEELVDRIVTDLGPDFKGSVIDIGTGTGCIAIALAKAIPNAHVSATDVSLEALELAKANAKRNKAVVNFVCDDFSASEIEAQFDVLVSNPPYVLLSEAVQMDERVNAHEPHLALFSPEEDDLYAYRHILDFSAKHLNEGASIYLELNAVTAQAVLDEYIKKYENAELISDLSGKMRFLKV